MGHLDLTFAFGSLSLSLHFHADIHAGIYHAGRWLSAGLRVACSNGLLIDIPIPEMVCTSTLVYIYKYNYS